jgi:beta-galactosidase
MFGVIPCRPDFVRRLSPVLIVANIVMQGFSLEAQTTSTLAETNVFVDASQPADPAQETPYKSGSSLSPAGHRVGVDRRYLTMDDKPWLPVMGEFQYSRYPDGGWENEILKMKAGGVQIVSTYVIWIHHEEAEGEFDWTGQRDLHRFVTLCAQHGMYVYLRIGPWVHGETRNGGLPDWLLRKGPTRESDPVFLHYVERFDRQIAQQVQGMMWKDGGPIIGIQLENEYRGKNREAAEQYILTLKRMAIESGMDVPLYSVTGWNNAVVPRGAVLPVYGGYPDAPWNPTNDDLPASEVYAFRFSTRVSGDAEEIRSSRFVDHNPREPYPFLTAEVGGGLHSTYHRRPVVAPDDIAAMCPVFLGSGVNLLGLYMYHGGENPDGRLSTLQESKATGSPTDVPVKSYDFQAPLSEFGEERASFRRLKLITYFLTDFGGYLAPMTVHAPSKIPESPEDLSVPRISVRNSADSGFIFVNNRVRHRTMPNWKNFQVTIKLPDETIKVPDVPVTIPDGAYSIWPFNLDMKGVRLRYSTAQLFTTIDDENETDYFFFAVPGVRADFCFTGGTFAAISGNFHARTFASSTLLENMTPGMASNIVVHTLDGKRIRIFLLSRDEAEDAWKATLAGQDRILFTADQFFGDEKRVYLQSNGDPHFAFEIFPTLRSALAGSASIENATKRNQAETSSFVARVPEHEIKFQVTKIRDAQPVAAENQTDAGHDKDPVPVPDGEAFSSAAAWRISFHGYQAEDLSELFLRVDYTGDVARLSSGGNLLTDNFFNGIPWVIGLKRLVRDRGDTSVEVSILPWKRDVAIKLEKSVPHLQGDPDIAELGQIKLTPQYQLIIDKLEPHR